MLSCFRHRFLQRKQCSGKYFGNSSYAPLKPTERLNILASCITMWVLSGSIPNRELTIHAVHKPIWKCDWQRNKRIRKEKRLEKIDRPLLFTGLLSLWGFASSQSNTIPEDYSSGLVALRLASHVIWTDDWGMLLQRSGENLSLHPLTLLRAPPFLMKSDFFFLFYHF